MRRIAFFGGKGGVGKTTMATAYAAKLARGGQRVLLVSTDPAHSTGDLLAADLTGDPQPVAESLWAVEIDAEREVVEYIGRIKDDAHRTLSRDVLPTVDRHLDLARHSPGTLESAVFDRLIGLLDRCPADFDRVVVDTAPTGHTLRLLVMPTVLTGWVEGLVRQRETVSGIDRMLRNMAGREPAAEDPLVTRLRLRRDRFQNARRRLVEDAQFHLVLVPERLPIEETERAARSLDGEGLDVAAIIVNRVFPSDADGSFMKQRIGQQDDYLREIDQRFADRVRIRVEHEPTDVTEQGQLDRIADQLATGGI